MHIPDDLSCLFSAQLEERDGSYIIDVPEQELSLGDLQAGHTYRVAILSSSTPESDESRNEQSTGRELPEPPVSEGDQRTVEIEDIGEQGDGITRVERGYVVIVPDTEQGERVRIEIDDVQQNVAFAEVIERIDYYD